MERFQFKQSGVFTCPDDQCDPNGALWLPQNTIKVLNWGAEVQHHPPEASSEWVRLPGGDTSHRGIDLWGQILTDTKVSRG